MGTPQSNIDRGIDSPSFEVTEAGPPERTIAEGSASQASVDLKGPNFTIDTAFSDPPGYQLRYLRQKSGSIQVQS